jgi:hypothetical protein
MLSNYNFYEFLIKLTQQSPFSFIILFALLFSTCFILAEKYNKYFPKITFINILYRSSLLLFFLSIIATFYYFPLDHRTGGWSGSYATLIRDGGQLYHNLLDSAERYSQLYGPVSFIWYGWMFKVFGASITTLKATSVLISLSIFILIFLSFRRSANLKVSVIAIAYLILCLGINNYFPYKVTLNNYVLFFVALAIFGIGHKNKFVSFALCSISFGLIFSTKLNGILFMVPIMGLFFQRYGFKMLILLGVSSILVSLSPFVLPNVSLTNFIEYIGTQKGSAANLNPFIRSLTFAIILFFLPIIGLIFYKIAHSKERLSEWFFNRRLIFILYSFSIILSVYISSKTWQLHHIMPLTIFGVYFVLLEIQSIDQEVTKESFANKINWEIGYKSLGVSLVTFFIIFSYHLYEKRFDTAIKTNFRNKQIIDDINYIMKEYKGNKIHGGYGHIRWMTEFDFFPLLQFAGHPYFVDGGGPMRAMGQAGIKIPDATIEYLAKGKIDIWIIPKKQRPFEFVIENKYKQKTFDQRFRDTFKKNYKIIQRTKFFDVYSYIGQGH